MPFVSVAGHRFAYERIDGSEPTLVFLHEGVGSIRQWRDFPSRVAAATGRRALVYDRYGYGDSDVLAEPRVGVRFMHDEALQALPQLLAALGIERPILIGHSDGASIALIHAGGGHVVRGVVVMAPHMFVEEICLSEIAIARQRFETTDLAQRLAKYHRDARRTFHLWNDVWLDPAFRAWNIEDDVARIRVPVLAIQGEEDEYGTTAQLDAIARHAQGPCEIVELPRCGHAPHRDQPDATLAAVAAFIAKITRQSA